MNGVSVIIANSKKGEMLVLKDSNLYTEERGIQNIGVNNDRLFFPVTRPKIRGFAKQIAKINLFWGLTVSSIVYKYYKYLVWVIFYSKEKSDN